MELLFVYGTLHEPAIQLELIGRVLASRPDSLDGYERNLSLLPPYPVAMPAQNEQIMGHVLEISLEELSQFDIYETEAYQRIRVKLASGIETWVYIGNPSYFE